MKTFCKKYIYTFCAAITFLFCMILAPAAVHADDNPFKIHLLDVGQGLSVLIEADGHYMLYDGGERSSSSFVVSYLKQQGAEHLDYIVASHYHEDHIAGLVGALNVFRCDTILCADYETDTDIYDSFFSAALSSGAEIIHPQQGEHYTLGNADIEVLGPCNYSADDENNSSIALRITYGNCSVLMSGDAEIAEEEAIVNTGTDIDSDILIVNHHGSDTSNGHYFLNQVSPQYALISCGAGNSYGHPHQDVMDRLQAEGCEIFRTDVQGTITASSDGSSVKFDQEPCQDWSSGYAEDAAPSSGYDTSGDITYICNENSKKFHYAYCDSVAKMKESNKRPTTESREVLILAGYEPCKNCNP